MALRHMRIWQYPREVARTGSIRKAAEKLNVTPSAVQRRIEDIENDLGTKLFERSKRGMKLTAAGELFIHWVQTQAADLVRVESQIEALAGLRRGQVRVACSQAFVHTFLPREIGTFAQRYPLISFSVEVCDHDRALRLLQNYEADLALVFSPTRSADLHPLMVVPQRLVALMSPKHPLAKKKLLRLRDCVEYPIGVADRNFSTRQILSSLIAGKSSRADIRIETNSFELLRNFVGQNDTIAFHIEIGAMPPKGSRTFVARHIDSRDGPNGVLVLGHLKERVLPVAAARFGEHLALRIAELRTQSLYRE
jgi:DNA-binding transcriptional LysR family regulator